MKRVDRHVVNKRAMEALIKAGAFDALEETATRCCSRCLTRFELADKAEARQATSESILAMRAQTAARRTHVGECSSLERARQTHQRKQALGFYSSGHPFSSYEKEVRQIVKTALKDIAPNTMVLLVGILHESRVKTANAARCACSRSMTRPRASKCCCIPKCSTNGAGY